MGVDKGNIQVMDGCRNDNEKNMSNNYSYGTPRTMMQVEAAGQTYKQVRCNPSPT